MTGPRGPRRAAGESLPERRWSLLHRVTGILEPVMVVLSAVWIALLVADLVNRGLPHWLETLVWAIWLVFGLDFLLRLVIAPSRTEYVRTNWLTVLSLLLPAFRVLRAARALRFLRAARLVRSVGLLRIATSINRGLGALGRTAQRRGAGYVAAATALVTVIGAAGMTYFEAPGTTLGDERSRSALSAFTDYGSSLWWTANAMTTGPTESPRSAEGRLLGWLLSVYGLAVFGYLTAILASHFVGQDRARGGER